MGQSLCCDSDPCTKNATLRSYINDVDLPHKCSEILKDAYIDVHAYCKDKLYDMLYNGILIWDGKAKYWVDRQTGKNSFMLFAKNLKITDITDHHKWSWQISKSKEDMRAEMAVMGELELLSVRGSFNAELLSPDTKYKVEFVLRFRKSKHVSGWDKNPVRTILIPPGETWKEATQKQVNLAEIGSEEPFEILVGELFIPQFISHEEVQFHLDEKKEKKTGLVIKGVKITPV